MSIKKLLLSLTIFLFFPFLISAQNSDSPANARAYISSPQHGAVVPSFFTVVFGLSGLGVAPAGQNVEDAGHHHLLIDVRICPT